MTDLLSITSNRIVIRDTDGSITFDTDERPFLPLATINGSIAIPAREGTSNSSGIVTLADINQNTLLATCPAVCNVVRGAFYVSASGVFGLTGLGYFNAGGTYIHAREAATICAYTFVASGGGVYLNERSIVMADVPASGSQTMTIFTATLTYRLIAGVFL